MISRFIILLTLCSSLNSFVKGQALFSPSSKVNGVNFKGPADASLDVEMVKAVKTIHSNWVSFVPTAIVDRSTLTLRADDTHHVWAETRAGVEESLRLAKETDLKIMIKPHIFLERLSEMDTSKVDKTLAAVWRGDFVAQNEEDWIIFEEGYRRYIMDLLQLATAYKVDLFCIGTELREFVQQRSEFWVKLIKEIKANYSGKLTYSANWDEYSHVPFWSDLDYIGVDAYFPISKEKTPTESKAFSTWMGVKFNLETTSKSLNKPVLFTEYGYRNVDFAGREPWTHDKGKDTPNTEAQVNLYSALYRSFWDEEWMAGGFLWTWNFEATGNESTDFNINNKAVLGVVRDWYR